MKRLPRTAAGAMLVFPSAAPIIAQDKENDMQDLSIPAPLDALVSVINGGDTEGYLALLTEDSVVDDNGDRYVGKVEIKTWSDRELIGAKGVMTVQSVETHGTEIHLISDWKSNFYTGPGRFIFSIRDGKISEWRIRVL
ncbi:MAG: nuclear transport factor 2 family protein [Pseudochelatococcus sp.]|uniref:nuclear transport factor 2 family protein n=1 Tax=Pseudochelatococcus sp. TaxID=2020869 RepID=UPI003D8DCF68